MDYTSLTDQIAKYANRVDVTFVAEIPNFIDLAIEMIYNEAKGIGFQTRTTAGERFDPNNPLIPKPANWKETVSLSYIDVGATAPTNYVLPRSYQFCLTYSPNPTLTGNPVFYADYDQPTSTNGTGSLYLAPTPAENNEYTLTYLGLPLFNAANPRNFLTDRYPSLLLYGCLVQALLYLKTDERLPIVESLYGRALKNLNTQTREAYTDATSMRDRV